MPHNNTNRCPPFGVKAPVPAAPPRPARAAPSPRAARSSGLRRYPAPDQAGPPRERDFIALVDGVHQLVRAPIVLVWDRLNTHVSRRMRDLVTERTWLTVFLLPAYSPDLNPVEGVWAVLSRCRWGDRLRA
ncbi:transposase [Streptomyces sp. NPDC048340]|uniref:transposase n=1 Tax=Streptomyces sp. NPDC048340 TaxID=3365537 RepID=UPI0037118C36